MADEPAIFIADAPGLDFLNSIATPADTTVDWIADGEGFLRWLGEAGLVPKNVLRKMRGLAAPGELDEIASVARHLRERYRGFVRARMGRPLAPNALGELESLNRLLEMGANFSQIAPLAAGPIPFELRSIPRLSEPAALLFLVAEALARLVCTEDFSHVKACEGATCTLLFVDRTRGHARRWCSMAICGNRAKQAAHRHRLKAH